MAFPETSGASGKATDSTRRPCAGLPFDRERCVRHESKETVPVHGRRGVERSPDPEAISIKGRRTGARRPCPSSRSEGAMAPVHAGWVPLVPQRPRWKIVLRSLSDL